MVNRTHTERGRVIAVDGNRATVQLEPHSGCEVCGLCHRDAEGHMRLELDAPEGLRPGQTVLVGDVFPSSWAGSIFLFLLPPVGLLVGLAVGVQLFGSGAAGLAATAALGIVGLAVFLAAGFAVDRRMRRTPQPSPHIVEVYSSDQDATLPPGANDKD